MTDDKWGVGDQPDDISVNEAPVTLKDFTSGDLVHVRRLVTLVRSSLGRKFQTSDYLPDRFDDANTPPARSLITDACAEFMEHQRVMHEWALKAEKALNQIEGGKWIPTLNKRESQQPVELSIKQQLSAQTCLAGDCAPEDLVIQEHNVYAILQRVNKREVR